MCSAEALTALKAELLQALVPQVLDVLARALREGTAVHQVEADLWDLALQLGRRSLAAFFAACGSGDLGETLTLPKGCARWPITCSRPSRLTAGQRNGPRRGKHPGAARAANGQPSSAIMTVTPGSPSPPGPHSAFSRTSGGVPSRSSLRTWTPKRTSAPDPPRPTAQQSTHSTSHSLP